MNYQLSKGEVLTLIGSEEVEAVLVRSGRVWLTREGDPRDYGLAAGTRFACRKTKMLVIEALDDASLAVSLQHKEAPSTVRITLALSCQPNS